MSKGLMGLLIVSGLLATTAARSIAQFELKPASSSSQRSNAATPSTTNSDAKTLRSTMSKFPQVGEVTAPSTVAIGWLIVIGEAWIWQGGRRYAG